MRQDSFLHVNLVIQVIRKPHLLDVKVFLQQLLFISDVGLCISLSEHMTEQLGEREDVLRDLVIPLIGRAPVQRVERIVEEMRIDLRLQRPQFTLLFLQCHDIIGVDQLLDRVYHLVKSCRHLPDLSAGRHRNLLLKIPFFKAFHRNAQFL